ncbi:MAG: 2-oxoglutarate synthase subunit alpha [candidate division Zixibacteria bacterium RBG_16_53_22]|nr:MAG: 2-oxoglutarate synthase subunit alpha [candidate division Zixibacteria bacterium RBG_16_53_22]
MSETVKLYKSNQPLLMQGNEACGWGALAAGCRFFAGYPITPSTEIAELLARNLPRVGGYFIQMEDEIASIAAIIGASVAGSKSMTATSGPGYSLMQENLGYAYMAEVPIVVVNVQRGGPSTGLPTKVSQADTMQAKWGTHGDYYPIVLAPSSVKECFDMTIKAFNMAEQYRVPVTVLTDEVLGHMREIVILPEPSAVKVLNRPRPVDPPEWYKHFEITPDYLSPMASFGEGYRFHLTGLTHDESGFPTAKPNEIKAKLDKLKLKITRHREQITEIRSDMMEDAHIMVFAYGSTARAARQAIRMARKKRFKVGMVQPYTIWPFPDDKIAPLLENVDTVVVPELNQGQIIGEIERLSRRHVKVVPLQRYDGELITPSQIVDVIKEEHA